MVDRMLYRRNHVAGLYAQLIKYLSNSFYNVTSLSAYLSHQTYWQLGGSEITLNAKANPSLLKTERSLTLSWWMQIEMLGHMPFLMTQPETSPCQWDSSKLAQMLHDKQL